MQGPKRISSFISSFAAILIGATAALAVACGHSSGSDNTTSSAAASFVPTEQQQHNLDKLNAYRATGNLTALTIDGQLSAFALAGSQQLAGGGAAHGHFNGAGGTVFQDGFCGQAAENQAPGWYGGDDDSLIDQALQEMMDEGPGGGHYDNIMNGKLTRVGVGMLHGDDGKLYITNDFSGPCAGE